MSQLHFRDIIVVLAIGQLLRNIPENLFFPCISEESLVHHLHHIPQHICLSVQAFQCKKRVTIPSNIIHLFIVFGASIF